MATKMKTPQMEELLLRLRMATSSLSGCTESEVPNEARILRECLLAVVDPMRGRPEERRLSLIESANDVLTRRMATLIEERDIVKFCHTGRDHQVRDVRDYGYVLCGMPGRVVHADEIALVRKAEPRNTEFDGMTREQVKAIISKRLEIAFAKVV